MGMPLTRHTTKYKGWKIGAKYRCINSPLIIYRVTVGGHLSQLEGIEFASYQQAHAWGLENLAHLEFEG
jgi:hypothetical protein